MSMPIITVPLERIERHINKPEGAGYADDRPLSPESAQAFEEVIQKGKLSNAPFFDEGAWRFLKVESVPLPNIAQGLPPELAQALASEDARKTAHSMNASQWISVLRNAMAHGGIAYLDEHGQSSYDSPVKMYAFVSGKYGKPKCKHAEDECRFGLGALEGLSILSISEDDYRRFLVKWVQWLKDSKLARLTAA